MSSQHRAGRLAPLSRRLVVGGVLAAVALTSVASQARLPLAPQQPGDKQNKPQHPFIGRNPDFPRAIPGQLVVRFAPGANAAAIAASVGLNVDHRLTFAPHTYVLTGVAIPLEEAVARMGRIPGVLAASPNGVFRPTAVPSIQPEDPFIQQQWPMRVMNAPNTWGVTVGERLENGPVRNVLVGVIDVGFDVFHPDLAENVDPNGYDFIRNQPYDQNDVPLLAFFQHGTSVAGCVAAVTNNQQGIASLPWEAVKVLPCQAGDFGGLTSSAILDALYYCIEQDVDVINMSFGAGVGFTDPLIEQAIIDAYDQGIVMCASTGNGRFFGTSLGVGFPANLPEVIPVGAVGPSGELAFYSDGGPELSAKGLVAPGGNDSTFFDAGRQVLALGSSLLSPIPAPAGLVYEQGTSFSSPFVAAATAVLITQGAQDETLPPGLQVEQIRALLRSTARNPFGGANNDFGAGILNVEAAMRRITQVIEVNSPAPNEITESFAEPVEARITFPVTAPLQDGAFSVFQNGSDVTGLTEITDPNAGTLRYEPNSESRYSIGNNSINIVADNPATPGALRGLEGPAVGRIPARAYRFRVIPHVEQPGLKMFSVPYELQPGSESLGFLTGGNLVRLARFLPDQNRYAIFDIVGSPQDPEAALTTDSAGVTRPPIGVGFWARVVSQTQVQVLGSADRTGIYEIPIQPGFNMVGNPYNFRVPWNVVSVQFGQELMSVTEAARRNLMSNVIWRYQDGRYTFKALPDGELVEWESHWVRSFRNLTLLVPRVLGGAGSSAAASPASRVAQAGWKSSLRASAGGRTFGEVVLGEARGAQDGFGPEDVENPPPAFNAGDVGVQHRDWGACSGRYAQDIRARNGRGKRWTIEVETSAAGVPVKLAWDRFPDGVRAYVDVEGRVRPLSSAGAIELRPAQAGKSRVTVFTIPGRGA